MSQQSSHATGNQFMMLIVQRTLVTIESVVLVIFSVRNSIRVTEREPEDRIV